VEELRVDVAQLLQHYVLLSYKLFNAIKLESLQLFVESNDLDF